MKEEWICPRCGKVNAPFMLNCDCKLDEAISNADSECGCGGKHEWHIISNWGNLYSDRVTYICDKCGKIKKVYNSEIT